ncbi:MAG: DNA glycosylase [Bilifractor sp.]|jgi:N-glycosylase/DNA lyase
MEVYAADGIDLRRIYDSGQCFRWRDEGDGNFLIPSAGHIVMVRQIAEDRIRLSCDEEEFQAYWRDYFDLDTDYAKIAARISPQDAFLTRAAAAGRGIRILRQDPWETLITFILSQRKNIPAIRSCVERLCEAAGTSEMIGCFPTPEEILAADAAGKLDGCGLGYRLPYIRETAEVFASNQIDQLSRFSDDELLDALMQLKGVGVKVAKCTMLFGFHRLDAFPVDVWISRALAEEYPEGFDFSAYRPYGGVIQQYIFAYYRENARHQRTRETEEIRRAGEIRMSERSKTGNRKSSGNSGNGENSENNNFHLKRLDRKLAYQGKILGFYQDTVELPDGSQQTWDFIHHPTGGACVVAVLPNGKILMERQYRPAIGAETLELPAGARQTPDEDPRKTARRELEEETGYTCGRLIFLAEVSSAPSWCDEKTYIYLAANIRPAGNRHLDEAEEIRLEAYTPKQLLAMIRRGEICDAKTVAGIMAYAVRERV